MQQQLKASIAKQCQHRVSPSNRVGLLFTSDSIMQASPQSVDQSCTKQPFVLLLHCIVNVFLYKTVRTAYEGRH